jgi:hypothetical protein
MFWHKQTGQTSFDSWQTFIFFFPIMSSLIQTAWSFSCYMYFQAEAVLNAIYSLKVLFLTSTSNYRPFFLSGLLYSNFFFHINNQYLSWVTLWHLFCTQIVLEITTLYLTSLVEITQADYLGQTLAPPTYICKIQDKI